MSSTFEFKTEGGSLTVGRYAAGGPDVAGSHRRYTISDCYDKACRGLTRADLAALGAWIVAELHEPHEEA